MTAENRKHIHVIEDEEDIIRLIQYNLSLEGFDVTSSTQGEAGLKEVEKSCPDLVILDLMLPGIDGLEVCRRLKQSSRSQEVPVVMVTAKGEEQDIVRGLELGADDYITKPFSPKVLCARVKAVLRRDKKTPSGPDQELVVGDLVIHPGRHEVKLAGERVDLTTSEFDILHYLALRPGWVFTRTQIVDAVRGENYAVTERSIDVQVVGLRKKLGRFSFLIETVRGVGYRFKEPSE